MNKEWGDRAKTVDRVRLNVDLGILADNFRGIANRISPSCIISVLKADAYGLGAHPIAAALKAAGCSGFGVATPEEALELTQHGLPVQLLSSVLPDEIAPMIAAGIELPITDYDTAAKINSIAGKMGRHALVHLKIDTGMGRLGLTCDEMLENASRMRALQWLNFVGIASHFPCSDDEENPINEAQLEAMRKTIAALHSQGFDFSKRHIAASGALLNLPASYRLPFNAVRAGLILYGVEKSALEIVRPAVTLHSRVIQERTIKAGCTIGYAQTFTAPRNLRVAVVAAGYADGVPLALSNRGHVLIAGKPCPILGKVSMDCMSVSLENVEGPVSPGEEAVLLGNEAGAMSVTDWANAKGTHEYDILCSLGKRVKRNYVK